MAAPLQTTIRPGCVRLRIAPHSSQKLAPPSRRFMAASWQTTISAGAWSRRRQALSTRVPEAETSRCVVAAAASTLHPSARGRAEHVVFVCLRHAPHRTAAASLLHQVGASWRLRGRPQSVQVRGRGGGKHSTPECHWQRRARTYSPPSHRTATAAASLLHQVGGSWRLRCRPQSVQVRGRGGKHSHAECQMQTRARPLRPPPPRTTQQQLQACSTKSELHSGSDTMHNQKDVSASILHRL